MSAATSTRSTRAALRSGPLADVLVALVTFVVLGVVGALAWWQLADLPRAARVGNGVVLGPEQLGSQVSVDGWFFVVAVTLAAMAGAALTTWRHRDPLLMVVLVALGAGLASYVMVRLGLLLGPPDPQSVLAGRGDGATAPVQLELQATGMAWVWPAAASLGSLLVLWVFSKPDTEAPATD